MSFTLLKQSLMSIVFGLVLSSCLFISFNKPILISEELSSTSGYVYGRFNLNKADLYLSLRVRNIDTSKYYYIRFQQRTNKKMDIFPVPLPPGNYYIEDLIMTKRGLEIFPYVESDYTFLKYEGPCFMRTFSIRANVAYYIGDFYGWITTESATSSYMQWSGELEKYEWAFEKTSEILLKEYPNFQSINLMPAWD